MQAVHHKRIEFASDGASPSWSEGRVEALVEAVCQRGCRQVRQAISTLDQGKDIPESLGLSPDHRRLLLHELKAIMAVYGDTCRIG